MQWKNSSERFGAVHQGLHWLIAIAFIVMLGVGLYMTSLSNRDPLAYSLFQFHKSLGFTVLALVVLRILWRGGNTVPPLPKSMKHYEKGLAHLTHYGLYAALLLMPLSGWVVISSSSSGVPTKFWGLFDVPMIGFIANSADKHGIHEASEEVHELIAWIAIALIVLHLAGAFYHHFVVKDDVLARMTPGLKTPGKGE